MYDTAYRLNSDPFRLCPDHRYCFNHKSYKKNKSYLEYALHRGEGFVMITGVPGSGKTTLLNDVLEHAHRRAKVTARIVTTQLNADDLLRMVASAFKINIEGLDKARIILQLEKFLIEQYQRRKTCLLVIDEAQDLDKQALEEMRLLTNIQYNDHPLLQVFLVGQNNLIDIVQDPAMAQLHQRLIASSHLEPMNLEETGIYIIHRLRIAGWHHDPMFTQGAVKRIFFFSRGIPRIVNQFCNRFLLYGAIENKHRLDSHDAKEVINELTQEHLAPILDSSVMTHPYDDEYMEDSIESLEILDEQYLDYDEDPTERIIDEVLYQNINNENVTPAKETNKEASENKSDLYVKEMESEDINEESPVQPSFSGHIEPEVKEQAFNKEASYEGTRNIISSIVSDLKQTAKLLATNLIESTKQVQHKNESYRNAIIVIAVLAAILLWVIPKDQNKDNAKVASSELTSHKTHQQHASSAQQESRPLNKVTPQKKAKTSLVSRKELPDRRITTKTLHDSLVHQSIQKTSSKLAIGIEAQKVLVTPLKNDQTTIVQQEISRQPNIFYKKKESNGSAGFHNKIVNNMQRRNYYKLSMNIVNQFPRGSSDMTTDLEQKLSEVAKILKDNSTSVVYIIGYCDKTGSRERNIYLSIRRADAAANFLINKGVSRHRIFTKGLGSKKLISLTNPALNRRVEIFFNKPQPHLASNAS
jgi:type II secretory pathway predicted ATPase ExeA/outer membrane protein OmpA-like peptidoglycan-associated protein